MIRGWVICSTVFISSVSERGRSFFGADWSVDLESCEIARCHTFRCGGAVGAISPPIECLPMRWNQAFDVAKDGVCLINKLLVGEVEFYPDAQNIYFGRQKRAVLITLESGAKLAASSSVQHNEILTTFGKLGG